MSKVWTSSVSQVENYVSCNRKWFLSSVDYLPQEPRRATAIGDCLHQVIERYLKKEDGQPEPDLYPTGWNEQRNSFTNELLFVLDESEQKIIKALVQKGIDHGVIIRRPNSIVEYSEKVHITPEITFQVRIDYAYDWTIEDHKTCKDFRHTLVSDPEHNRYIGNDTQLRVYAYFWANKRHAETGEAIPEYLTIRHNQYCVGDANELPRIVSTKIRYQDCVDEYESVKQTVLNQLELRQKHLKGEITFKDVDKDISTCSAYGGCPFKTVCTGTESVDMYKNRIKKKINNTNKPKESNMAFNLSAGATKDQAKVLEAIDKKVDAPVVTKTAPEPATAPATAPAHNVAGMTIDGLNKIRAILVANCEEAGIDPNMSPKIKDVDAKIEILKAQAEAEAKAKAEAEAKALAEQQAKAEAEAKAKAEQQAKTTPKVKPAPKVEVIEPEPKPETVTPSDTTSDFVFKAPTASRSKETFVYINCAPIGSPVLKIVTIQEVFAIKSAELAKVRGVESYYDLPAFERRDSIKRAVPHFFKELEGLHIVSYTTDPDEQALLTALLGQSVRAIASR